MKNHLVLLAAMASLCAGAAAQAVTPGPLKGKEGDGYAYYTPGIFANGRFQIADGEIKTAQVIRRLGFRLDGTRTYSVFTGMGRSWSKMTVTVGATDTSKLTTTFASNFTGKQTTVFNAAYSWPSKTSGRPTTSPAPWNNAYSWLLSTPFLATGRNEVLFDFVTSGGKLANNSTWGTSFRFYYFDGMRPPTSSTQGFNTSTPTFHPPRAQLNCGDPNSVLNAFTTGEIKVYNNASTNGANRNMTIGSILSVGTDPGKPVIQVADPIGTSTGVNLGAACNNLYVGMSPAAFVFLTRASTFSTGFAETIVKLPNNAALTGTKIWTQSAWTHSKLVQFALTGASETNVPTIPSDLPNRFALYNSSSSSATAFRVNDFRIYWYMQPGIKYDVK